MGKTIEDNVLEHFGKLSGKKGISRADVIREFQEAFDQMGGTPRLALWADMNPTEFYRLYGRLLPQSNSEELDGPQEVIVRHVLESPNMAWQRAIEVTDAARNEVQGLPHATENSSAHRPISHIAGYVNENAPKDTSTHLPAQGSFPTVSREAAEVGLDGGPPAQREDRRDSERHRGAGDALHNGSPPPASAAGEVRVHRPVLFPGEGNRVGVHEDVQSGAPRKAAKRR